MENKYSEQEYRGQLVGRILEVPAAICHDIFQDFTLRGEGKSVIAWNETMLRDKGMPVTRLRDICVMLENKAEIMGLTSQIIYT